jgi:hypothetical protein
MLLSNRTNSFNLKKKLYNKNTSKANFRQAKNPIVILLASLGFQFNLAPFGAVVFSAHLYPRSEERGLTLGCE